MFVKFILFILYILKLKYILGLKFVDVNLEVNGLIKWYILIVFLVNCFK